MITLEHVSKEFRVDTTRNIILSKINLSIDPEKMVSITGESGTGKTTLLNIIGGLSKPNSGTVIVKKHNLSEMDEEGLAAFRSVYIGFVFQLFCLIDTLTTLENVILPAELAGFDLNDALQRGINLLTKFGLKDRIDALPDTLSGGEAQRAAFARALIMDPDILLIDEPTANLDRKTAKYIANQIAEMKGQKTIILVTHDPQLLELSDSVYSLIQGSLHKTQ